MKKIPTSVLNTFQFKVTIKPKLAISYEKAKKKILKPLQTIYSAATASVVLFSAFHFRADGVI